MFNFSKAQIMRKYLLIVSIFFLAGCSFEPSKKEVEIAVKESINKDFSILIGNNFGGLIVGMAGIEAINVELVDKIGCEASGKNTYLCEVAIEFNIATKQDSFANLLGVSGTQKSLQKYKFAKTSKGWLALEVE
jgi:hypothetical protein